MRTRTDEVDLVADEERRRRDVILEEAARQFAAKGYRLTRIADICEALGIAPRALYDHFPTKQALFVACYHVYADWLARDVEPHVEEQTDPAARLIWRMSASAAIQAFGPDLQALAQAASVHDDGELQEMVQDTYRVITERAEADLASLHDPARRRRRFPRNSRRWASRARSSGCSCASRGTTSTTCATRCARTSCCTWRSRRCSTAGSTSAAGWPKVEALLDEVSRRPLPAPPPA